MRVPRLLGCLAALVSGGASPVLSQPAMGPGTGGTAALRQAERMVGHTKRVLLIAAHPDDEDTELLTVLVRGEGAETAYLSLSRGEGGQNLIGPELGPLLGLIRTEELLAARGLDGARQYFTRAFDFGYSKTLEETARYWPPDSVLKDVVRIVRRFRPQIVVAMFSGTPRDGHGQHQMSGWAAAEAFRVAGDPGRFPELRSQEGLAPWTPLKFYRSARFGARGGAGGPGADPTVVLNGGTLDPDVGQSYRQIAMRSRSLHRSQDMGALQEAGPSEVRLVLVEDRAGGRAVGRSGDREELWRGIDTSAAPWPGEGIEARDQRRHQATAAAIRAGLVFDATTRDGRVVPGQRVMVRLSAWNAGPRPSAVAMALEAPAGWAVRAGAGRCEAGPVSVAPGTVAECDVEVTVSPSAGYSTPYFLRAEPAGDGLYRWSGDPADWGEPFERPPLRATFWFGPDEAGSPERGQGTVEREVVHRFRDQAIGEIRRPILIVPRVDLALEPAAKLWPAEASGAHPFTVTLQHGAATPTTGTVALELPPGWPAVAPERFSLTREEERETLVFELTRPARAEAAGQPIRAVAVDSDGTRYQSGLTAVEYPHIQPRVRLRPAQSTVQLAAISLPAVRRVGYIRGAADRVPEALSAVGVPVELLDATALERGDLSRYDVIVVGSRAYETEPALGDNNSRLLDYVRAGGRLVVQYQQQTFFQGNFAPAPLSLAPRHDRVSDESAPVELLVPDHPVFNRPNRIRPSDWDGWVQELGLYFARSWDSSYTPLLALGDPGEVPLRGGLLIRPTGRGVYLYTGLAFFRQLPAGVVGAVRLFLNLLEVR